MPAPTFPLAPALITLDPVMHLALIGLGLASTLLLVAALVAKEVFADRAKRPKWGVPRATRERIAATARFVDRAILPLGVAFALFALVRLLEIA